MRVALAASVALTGSSMAFAGTCTVPTPSSVECTGVFTDTIAYPNVPDLTLVLGPGGVPTSVIPAAGAFGVDVTSPGDIGVTSLADIITDGASGIHVSGADSAAITSSGNIITAVSAAGARALDISADGDVDATNAGIAYAHGTGVYDVTAIRAESTGSDHTVSVDNQTTGLAIARAADGFAIGIYGYAATGDISIHNDGVVSATSTDGLADGIFAAAGTNVEVTNGATGSITANGFDWAAGIEAQSYDLTTVTNSGDISATATANDETNQIYGHAFGIYASGGAAGVSASNSGAITADGVFADGLYAQGGGPITVSNSGDITIGGSNSDKYLTTYYANGIHASNNYADSAIAVDNSGTIDADGGFGANGISAVATGVGSTVSVSNAGAISAASAGSDYSNGTGVLASGDAGADIHNVASGTIFASGNGYAYGVQALTFNGDANVVNDGNLTASADGDAKYSAYALGVLAFSQNGNASVSNTGSISAHAASQGSAASRGIYASGVAADVVNSGSITTDGGSSLGIGAVGTTGDVTVLNQGSIHASANKYSTGTGIIGVSTYGDVNLTNSSEGTIVAQGDFGAAGLRGTSFYGDVDVVNAGSIVLGPIDPSAFSQPNEYGVYAASRTGNVSVVNSGTILAQTDSNAFGIYAFTTGDGTTTTVDNSGVIQAIGQEAGVWAIYTGGAGGGDISVHNSGTIEASTDAFLANGIWGCAGTYDYYAGGCTATGDISVVNDGTINAFSGDPVDNPSYYGLTGSRASGIRVYGADTAVTNTGSITAGGFALATGIEAHGTGQTTVSNSGDISVSATADGSPQSDYYGTFYVDGQAFGIKASGGAGGVSVTNSGGIDATAPFTAIGIYAYSADGDSSVDNDGAVSATSSDGLADGIFASGTNVDVTNGAIGSITANGFDWAAGIEAQGYDLTTVTNSGDISAVATANDETNQVYGHAFGIYASGGAAGVNASNSGAITAAGVFADGLYAQGGGPITVSNAGDITVGSNPALISYYANGIHASNNYADSAIAVDNSGTIGANGDFGANGISAVATGIGSTVSVTNAGGISAASAGSDYSNGTGVLASGDAGVDVRNTVDGTIYASGNGYAYGVQALTFNGDANVVNDGDLQASADGNAKYSAYALGVLAFSQNGNASVSNTGSISAHAASQGAPASRGIYASGVAADVVNSGLIETDGGSSLGIGAVGTTGDVTVLNQGSIHTTGNKYSGGTGISGFSTYGDVSLTNSSDGDIVAAGSNSAVGLRGVSFYGDVDVVNAGNIVTGPADPSANIFNQPNATGIYVGSRTGDVAVVNSGTILAQTESNAYGIEAINAGDGTLSVDNSGGIQVIGDTVNVKDITVIGYGGDIALSNSGTLEASTYAFKAIGIYACNGGSDKYGCGMTGNISVSNDGTITTVSNDAPDGASASALRGSRAEGIWVQGGHVDVSNGGSITANGFALATGIEASSSNQATVTNSGDISVIATANDATNQVYGQAFGIEATGGDGVSVINTGGIEVTSTFAASGIYGYATDGKVSITNRGTISAASTYGQANGIFASNRYDGGVRIDNRDMITATSSYATGVHAHDGGLGRIDITNRGEITAHGPYATGVYADDTGRGGVIINNRSNIAASGTYATGVHAYEGGHGSIDISNRGDITATGPYATGVYAYEGGNGGIDISNRGDITATGPYATGIYTYEGGPGDTDIVNRGDITSTSTHGDAYAIRIGSDGTTTVNNRGSIVAHSDDGRSIAVYGGDGVEKIINRGTIQGAIITNGGDDSLVNQRHSDWRLAGTSTDFGDGNDRFTNAAGAMLHMRDAAIAFGAGDNRIINTGTIVVSGHSAIDMTDGSAVAAAAALARPKHIASFMNNGVISMLDGAADDSLTVTGSFGGKGDIDLDVSLDNKLNDELFVEGGMLNGSKQHVNVMLLDGLPKASDVGEKLELVHVDGDTNPSVFKAGKVLGVSPRDFMKMGLTLSSTPVKHSPDGTSYMLTVKTYVKGLNAAGVLASSTALAVDSLMSSTIGERSDRLYMTAPGSKHGKPLMLGLTPWVRSFSYKSGMNPNQLAGNFGQLAHSNLTQNNYGTQMGLEYRAGNGLRFGTMLAKSEGRQYLVDGRGRDTIHGHTMGLYGTWISPSGFYVDASWRSMQFRAHIDSIGGRQRSEGRAFGTKLELGKAWNLGNGLTVAPQLRYTETTVDGLNIQGYQATFHSQDTQWKRASAGVALRKTFTSAGGWQWTPYGEANVVDTLDGVTDYTINRDYFGKVMTKGMSTQVKFGLGAQKGQLSWNGGVNWLGGGNVDGSLGAQMALKYSW